LFYAVKDLLTYLPIYICVMLIGLDIGLGIHMFDTPEERYLKLVKVGVITSIVIMFVFAIMNYGTRFCQRL